MHPVDQYKVKDGYAWDDKWHDKNEIAPAHPLYASAAE